MNKLPSKCPHCGHTDTTELVQDHVAGVVAEADYFCSGCKAHLGSYSYGAWFEGTGVPMTEAEAQAAGIARRNLTHYQRLEAMAA